VGVGSDPDDDSIEGPTLTAAEDAKNRNKPHTPRGGRMTNPGV